MASMSFNDPEMQELFEGYLIETSELLENLSQDLIEIETRTDDLDLINRIFRSFHTIKGTSSFMGFNAIAEITHHAEDILNKLRRGEMKADQQIIDFLLEVQDWITMMVAQIKEGNEPSADYSETIAKIQRLKETQVQSTETVEQNNQDTQQILPEGTSFVEAVLSNPEIASKPGDFTDEDLKLIDAAFQEINIKFKDEISQTTETTNESEVEPPISEPQIVQEQTKPSEHVHGIPVVEPTAENTSQQPTIQPSQPSIAPPQQTKPSTNKEAPKSPGKALSSDTIRIDVNRVEALMDLSGELVLGRNRLAQITEMVEQEFGKNEHVRDLIETTAQIDFVTSEIQAAVMRMRMVPIGKLYQKAPRIVRDLSKEFGKNINLVVKGEETEIDRGIIEELNDPLVHMIRNSCDHGIEPPEERIRIGKPEFGTITLDADQEGNNIVLRISDDGRGMDPEKLKAKALEKGIITHEQAAQMSAREAFQLIFAPGFSTAAKVTAVSGRGVGMDVVRSNIQNLKGMIDIESEVGKGTTFIIKLPLTLAIIQGLLVKVQDETYALPLSSVVEVVAINPDSVYTVSHQEVIRIRQEVIPILRLDRVLGVSNPREELDNRYVVNVGLGMQRIGLVVDELLGQQEIVIKSLGEYLGSITGVAGSTILGDGRVIMIIDVADLIQSIYKNQFMQFGK
ncbi:MAG TPA: chemotaxis protein CheA [Candidatus Kapabacteria bacterium]|nr:chemotaxis protein CheA [Candidatus Kapabacteria bacterium]